MKQTRKLLAILLALVLAMSAICVTAFAAHKKQYQSYVFFGDSVTTGFGIPSYFVVAQTTETGTAEGKRVPGAYPDLVAKGVGIDEDNENYYNEAHSGWRTSELRETLDPSYNNDDGAAAKALSQGMAGDEKELADPQNPKLQEKVREEIAKSDLITIDLGSNDIQLPIIMALYAAIYPQYASYFGQPEYKDWVVEDMLKKYGSENDLIVKLTEAVAKIHGIEYALEVVSKAALSGLYKFNTNYPAIINLIHEINPNADIYVIGLYNPLSDTAISDDIPIKIGKALDPVMMSLNLYLAQLNPAKKYYTYVDAFNTTVLGTITLSSLVGKDMNLAGMGDYTMYIHPNEDGHAYIAKQVLNAIPDVED
ncbi:MAG: GDSL-type esterase/lipase family protein, partial [Acutalibacteraceae bacterium]|nr:GDSL-type esterase/lipase family protein [Acutalibacteraceae bacterium]